MKKIFMALVLATILALPFCAFAMTTVADSDLSTVTGQAGVSIDMDVNMNVSIQLAVWGDRDGITNPGSIYTDRGFVGLSDLNITNLRLRARNPLDDFTLMSNTNNLFVSKMVPSTQWVGPTDPTPLSAGNLTAFGYNERFLTIDVGTDSGFYADGSDKTVVRIGVPTLEITMDKMTANVGTASLPQGMAAITDAHPAYTTYGQYAQQMGSLEIDGLIILMGNEGSIDISGRQKGTNVGNGLTNQGVGIGLNTVTIDWMKIQTVAWGDKDGIGQGTVGGWVGLYYTLIKDVVINGGITIDVATVDPTHMEDTLLDGGSNISRALTFMTYYAKSLAGGPDTLKNGLTFVSIGIADGTYVHMGLLDTVAGLADTTGHIGTAAHSELGEIIVKGLSVSFDTTGVTGLTPATGMQNGAFVNILAH